MKTGGPPAPAGYSPVPGDGTCSPGIPSRRSPLFLSCAGVHLRAGRVLCIPFLCPLLSYLSHRQLFSLSPLPFVLTFRSLQLLPFSCQSPLPFLPQNACKQLCFPHLSCNPEMTPCPYRNTGYTHPMSAHRIPLSRIPQALRRPAGSASLPPAFSDRGRSFPASFPLTPGAGSHPLYVPS